MKTICLVLALWVGGAARADEPKMEFEQYQLVLLLRGKNPPKLDKAHADDLLKQHLAHLRKMAAEGKMVVAGPFDKMDDPDKLGLCLYRVGSVDEARKLAESDPRVKAGVLRVEAMEWWTEKGAMTFPIAERMRKK